VPARHAEHRAQAAGQIATVVVDEEARQAAADDESIDRTVLPESRRNQRHFPIEMRQIACDRRRTFRGVGTASRAQGGHDTRGSVGVY